MTNFTFRYLNVPNHHNITAELAKFVLPNAVDKPTGLWALDLDELKASCPLCVNYLSSISQLDSVFLAGMVVVHPNDTVGAHVDRNIESPINGGNTTGCLSLNFNVLNGVDTRMVFYKYISGVTQIEPLPDPTQGEFIHYNGCTMEELCSYTLTTPIIMNNTVPHRIFNETDLVRVTLSFRLHPDPWEFAKTYEFG
jgi:hypothetical protein